MSVPMGDIQAPKQAERQNSDDPSDSSMDILFSGCGGSGDSITGAVSVAGGLSRGTTKASARQLTLNIVTGGFGIGLFSLPWSTAGASVVPATLVILFVLTLNAWTISILVEAAEKWHVYDLGAILSKLPGRLGKAMQLVVNLAIFGTLFLCLVGYITVMADVLQEAVHSRSLACILSSAVVLPLCFFDQAYLSFTSCLAVLVNFYVFVVMASVRREYSDFICVLGMGTGDIAMVSATMQAIVIQMCVLPMYAELEDRSPAKFNRIVANAFAILFVVFVAFAVVGYITFGPDVSSNILDAMPTTPFGKAAKVGAGVCVAAVYPILEKTMVAPIMNLQQSRRRKQIFTAVATVATVALSMFVTMAGLSLGYLNVVTGALSCGIFVALCPAIVGLFLLDCTFKRQFSLIALLVFGITAGALGLVFTKNYKEELHGNCAWQASLKAVGQQLLQQTLIV